MSGRIKVAPKDQRTYEGIVFASKHEMEQYLYMRALEKSGVWKELRRQVRFPLHATNAKGETQVISHYVADFTALDREDKLGVFDAKGYRTASYRIAKKWFEWEYWPLRIVEL
jgi:hypothetical protein